MVRRVIQETRVAQERMGSLDLLESLVFQDREAKKGTEVLPRRKDHQVTQGIPDQTVLEEHRVLQAEVVYLVALATGVLQVKGPGENVETKVSQVFQVGPVQLG